MVMRIYLYIKYPAFMTSCLTSYSVLYSVPVLLLFINEFLFLSSGCTLTPVIFLFTDELLFIVQGEHSTCLVPVYSSG